MADAAVVDFLLKLLGRQAGANLLLERQAANTGVLNAVDRDPIDSFAYGRKRNRQGVHREAWIDAGAEDGDLRFLRQRMDLPRQLDLRVAGIRELLGRGNDRHLRL